MAEIDESYIVHYAQTTCDMGLRSSRLVLTKSHGVFLKGKAQATIKDIKVNENIICFGGCISPENPATIQAIRDMETEVEAETGFSYDDEEALLKKFEIMTEEGKKAMACAGECIPVIISTEWDKEKEDVYVTPGKKALYGQATLTCKYGGIIKIETTGQDEE